jgi:hypothetical protein
VLCRSSSSCDSQTSDQRLTPALGRTRRAGLSREFGVRSVGMRTTSDKLLIWLLPIVLVALGGAGAAQGGGKPPQLTGLYSNLEYNEEGGDLVGMEVYLVRGATGLVAVVQCAGGGPTDPMVVPVEAAGERIRFRLPEGRADCGTESTGP